MTLIAAEDGVAKTDVTEPIAESKEIDFDALMRKYDTEARFEETRGILFNASGTCLQRVTVAASKVYFLHFFLKGNIRVQIIDNNGRYWNPTGGDIGSWSTSEYYNSFSTSIWDNKNIFFITDESVSAVTIKFVYAPGYYGFIDYVMLNAKTKASTFSLIAVFPPAVRNSCGGCRDSSRRGT